jgi:hypothetical protein
LSVLQRVFSVTGTVFITAKATDQDSPFSPAGKIQYRLVSGCADQFEVNQTTGEVRVATAAAPTVGPCNLTVSVYINYQEIAMVEWFRCWVFQFSK